LNPLSVVKERARELLRRDDQEAEAERFIKTLRDKAVIELVDPEYIKLKRELFNEDLDDGPGDPEKVAESAVSG